MYDDYIIDYRTLSFPSLVLYTFSRILVNKQSFAKNNRNLAVRACVVTIDPLSWRYSEMFVRQRGGFRSRDEASTFLRYRCVTSRNLWTKITIFRGISWYSLVFLCISWYFLVLLGISWYFLEFLGISWLRPRELVQRKIRSTVYRNARFTFRGRDQV